MEAFWCQEAGEQGLREVLHTSWDTGKEKWGKSSGLISNLIKQEKQMWGHRPANTRPPGNDADGPRRGHRWKTGTSAGQGCALGSKAWPRVPPALQYSLHNVLLCQFSVGQVAQNPMCWAIRCFLLCKSRGVEPASKFCYSKGQGFSISQAAARD